MDCAPAATGEWTQPVSPADHGCDVDGSPQIRGCGWYVDIEHPGGLVTRYCHMLVRPYVEVGQAVAVGEVIGIVGTSGNSSWWRLPLI